MIKKLLPILEWLPNYSKTDFYKDLPAGITVGIVLIPQGMAYALIAGLP
ncbi:MAG: SulP family inorganic anion transporter, partial [SAR324 cluster bacterium]|nr:SulP family inorganic anion transporter [SAR324 cluster bacterium]